MSSVNCLSKVAALGAIKYYGVANMVKRPGGDHGFTIEVPFPDHFKNSGIFMVDSVTVDVSDKYGKQDGVFKVMTADGEDLCDGEVGKTGTDETYTGFFGKATEFHLTDARTLVRTSNAVGNTICRHKLKSAIGGMLKALQELDRPGTTLGEYIKCRNCGGQGYLTKTGDIVMVPQHGPKSPCGLFEPSCKTHLEQMVWLCNKAMAIPAIQNISNKYRKGGPPQGAIININTATQTSLSYDVTVGFLHHVLALWQLMMRNTQRVSPSGISHLVVEGVRSAHGESTQVSVSVDMTIAQFYWDDPKECHKHISDLFVVNPLLPNTQLSLKEVSRVTVVSLQ